MGTLTHDCSVVGDSWFCDLTVTRTGNGTVTSDPAGIVCPSTCTASFELTDQGELPYRIVDLSATPDQGWRFDSWPNTGCSNEPAQGDPVCRVYMYHDTIAYPLFVRQSYRVTVTLAGSGSGRVTGSGIDCPGDCVEDYPVGTTTTTLRAAASTGSTFAGWSGDCAGTSTSCTLTLSADRAVTATFNAIRPTLTVTAPTGGKVTGTGIDCPGDCAEQYALNSSVQLTATASTGMQLSGWGGDCASSGTASTCSLTMNADKSVSATFAAVPVGKQQLTVSTTGSGKVTGTGIECPGDCQEPYDDKTLVQLTAAASGGATFSGWGGDCAASGTAAGCTVTMDKTRSVSATFATVPAENRLLTVAVTGSGKVTGSGIDCPGDCSQEYTANSTVTLTAIPQQQWSVTWGGDCAAAGGASTCSLALNAAKSVLADFNIVKPKGVPDIGPTKDPLPAIPPPVVEQVLVKVDGTGNVTSSTARTTAGSRALRRINCGVGGFACYGEYRPGEALTLTAKPASGYTFERWSGACSGAESTCRVVASNAKSVTAFFAQRSGGAAVAASLRQPRLNVRWQSSIGAGKLVVQGSTSVPARVRVDMRRPGGGPLATLRLTLPGGGFRQSLPLRRGALAGGAKLLPGGFVVALTGRHGKLKLPLQVQTIALPSPREGVVRNAYASTKEAGTAVARLPKGATEAWANFRFETQPQLNLPLMVTWYFPNGKPLGSVGKSNRPVVSSYLRLGTGLESGLWRAELRAGGRVVQRLAVRIG